MKTLQRDEARKIYRESGSHPFSFIAASDGSVRLTILGVYENVFNAAYAEVCCDTIKATSYDGLRNQ